MQQIIITCPKCKADIELTDTLAGPLLESTKKQAAEDLAAANKAKNDAVRKLASFEQEVADRIDDAVTKARIEAAASGKIAARIEAAEELRAAGEVNAALADRLVTAQRAQAAAIKREGELADKEREINLTIEREIAARTFTIRERATKESDEANRLRLLEKDTLLQSLETKVAELTQKITQGSQQLQGEVQELDLQAKLMSAFPYDKISEVGKGVNGADVVQEVISHTGQSCGIILWESKRTKNWSSAWLPKLRDDVRKANATVAILVSTATPEEIGDSFGSIDKVWVMNPRHALAFASVMRETLLAVHNVKQVQAGMATTAEEVYLYVTGPQFRHRVEALVEAFTTMQEDLTAEQKVQQRQWAKRAAQIERALTSTSGMFGDLQGIAGKALPAPAGLSLSNGGGE
jgi:hypothetical protein